jgi:hypothetical protein
MNINQLADIYVDVIEPVVKIGAFLILVTVVLHFLNVLKHGGSGSSLVGKSYTLIIAWSVAILGVVRRWLPRVVGIMAVYIAALIATVKDFWSSRN